MLHARAGEPQRPGDGLRVLPKRLGVPGSCSGLPSSNHGLSRCWSRAPTSRCGAPLCPSGTSPCGSGTPPSRSCAPGLVSGAPRTWPCGRGSRLGRTGPIGAVRGAQSPAGKPQGLDVDAHSATAKAQALGAPLRHSDVPHRVSDTPLGQPCVPPWRGGARHPRACAQASACGVRAGRARPTRARPRPGRGWAAPACPGGRRRAAAPGRRRGGAAGAGGPRWAGRRCRAHP